ncbi:molybdopterin-dependent oxidoreductase [Microbacterium sp. VKM Ac-2923]|jgi:DMSO/TMAO reductase YedYZ molybdopterin-dependent catalytic subunit|uniref:molybdopterin-dependent oxidoreductase n=1 Tax=Microbacterium sp. VKM Ac-2923 TaxID=2929476 RepID=UPI001FB35906|nr:molybdopterin-dependent oxidoreductase [Microbacterium sp. VKM Ac-2923]MCJ1709436.1 molybdopterin-dependent oxidoreductase [Microbacterium sp. VKM Ac-2923]
MSFITRGFGGRRRERDPRLPPGQSLVGDWPVLSAGPTPTVASDTWEFAIGTENGVHRWDRAQLEALGVEDITVDIHCVTHWTKLDMAWRGVSLDRIFAQVETAHRFAMVHSFGGYTTNLALDDLLGGKSWIAFEADGEPLSAEHGGPARLLVPHLYFWKSAKWVQGLITMPTDKPGFWEQNGYHPRGDPWREERYG